MSESRDSTRRHRKAKAVPPRYSATVRLLLMALLAGGLLCGGLWGTIWWEERPLRKADGLLDQKQPDEALALAEGFLRTHRDDGRAIALQARAFLQLGRPVEAARLFDQAGAASTKDMKACADAYLMLERWVQAQAVLEYLLQQDPHDSDVLHEVSACRAKLGQYDSAVQAAEQFAAIPGNEARGFLLAGMLEQERGNDRKACEAWSKVLHVNPDAKDLQLSAAEFFAEYAASHLRLGEPAEAEALLRKSLAVRSSARALSLLGTVCSQLGRDEEADRQWQNALKEKADDEEAHQGLAQLAIKRGDFQKALEWLQPLEESSKIKSASAFLIQRAYTLAGDSEASQKWQGRLEQLRLDEELQSTVNQIMIDSPESLWGRVLRAYRLAEKGNLDQAAILIAPWVNEDSHPFVHALNKAIQNQSPLPDLKGIPIELFSDR